MELLCYGTSYVPFDVGYQLINNLLCFIVQNSKKLIAEIYRLTSFSVMASNYKQGRHFTLTSSDSEDLAVLTKANELGKDTVVISTEDVDHEHTTSFSMPENFNLTWNTNSANLETPVITKPVEFNKLHLDNIESTKPYDIFKYVSNFDELIDFIVTESNRYATQKGKVFTTTSEEIKAFLGIIILMGYHKLPTVRSY